MSKRAKPYKTQLAARLAIEGKATQSEAARIYGVTRQGVSVWIARHERTAANDQRPR